MYHVLEDFHTNGPRGHGRKLYLLDHWPKIFSMFIYFYIFVYLCIYLFIYLFTFLHVYVFSYIYAFIYLVIFYVFIYFYILCIHLYIHVYPILWLSHAGHLFAVICKLRGHGYSGGYIKLAAHSDQCTWYESVSRHYTFKP